MPPSSPARRTLLATSAIGLAVARALWGESTPAAQLPVPCGPGSCAANNTPGFSAPAGFVTSGKATGVQAGNTFTVSQSTNQAILNWASFNVSADGKVIFNQPGATSIALNKIYQASPSSIFGEVTANGQIYLINPNGMVFGSTAKVNVAGLIASSLGLAQGDAGLANGILAPITAANPGPALQSDGRTYVTDASGNLVLDANGNPQPVAVVVQPGAQMTAAETGAGGGRLMLAGQNVTNGGSLSAPDGQVVLASGQAVYLAASTDPAMRGLIVEVSGQGLTTNQATGSLSAPRGNVSLVGMAVNQSGRISATTSVNANGSVLLVAAQGSPAGQGAGCVSGELLCANVGGTLTVGPTSRIDVAPDPADTSTAVVGETQLPSTVKLVGEQIDIHGGEIHAPGGQLSAIAAANPDQGITADGNTAAQIRIDAGTSIDLAGSVAQLPMSANLLTLQLRANELEDDPVQRNGPLHGQTVVVDVRGGQPPIISNSSWQSALQGIEENILQRTARGGSASFQSEGDIVVNPGASINVSGGQWVYAPGLVQTSWLLTAGGQAYNISTANPLLPFTSVLNPTYTQTFSGFGVQITGTTPGLGTSEAGYVQGFSAGSVQFAAPAMSLQGTLVGTAVNGPYQRSLATVPAGSLASVLASVNGTSPIATGGTLVIGGSNLASGAGGLPEFFAPPVSFATNVAPIIVADGTPLPPQPMQLPISYLTSGGFAQTKVYDDTSVTLPAGLPLNLGAGGGLYAQAPVIAIDSSIEAPGGTIALSSVQTASYPTTGAPRLGIDIGSGVTLDVRGQWTNDSAFQSQLSPTLVPTYQNGGTITLALSSPLSPTTFGGELVISDDVSLRASGGAWIKPNNAIVGGNGGQITLDASPYQAALQVGRNVELDAFGVQGAQGGAFTLAAPRINVTTGSGTWASAQSADSLANPTQAFAVGTALFSQDGFSSVTLFAAGPESTGAVNEGVLTLSTGTQITAQAESLQLTPGFLMQPTGGTVAKFSQAQLLPVVSQKPYTVTLEVAPSASEAALQNFSIGAVDIQPGASVTLNPNAGSSITLLSQGSILVGGLLRAPGGTITAQIQAPNLTNDPGYLPDQLIELGPRGILDVDGAAVLTPNSQNLNLGTVLPGGTVNLQAFRGQVVANAGSQIDVAGASAPLVVPTIGGVGGYANALIGSAGGTLLVQSVESASLLGTLSAAGGTSTAGTLFGGILELDVTQTLFSHNGPITTPLPTTPPTIDIVSSVAGSVPTAPYGNLAVLGVAQLEASGIDVLRLRADSAVNLNTNSPLKLARAISLDAPNIGVSYGTQAELEAAYVALTDSNPAVAATGTPLSGIGTLSISADQIALSGFTTLQGIGGLTLRSSGDVSFQPLFRNQLSGELALAGNLTIDAARVYPATNAAYTIADSLDDGTVTIGRTSASPGTPLSVGGSLTIEAANIVSSGRLLAPFGQIALSATNSLSLLEGSVTSVSADGALLPYGQTVLNQQEWIYLASSSSSESQMPVKGVPSRQVSLTAPHVSFAGGATIDVTGGGDLSSYEWVPGTGGSVDALGQQSSAATGLFAVLPSIRGQYAAFDIQEFSGSAVTPGESVYLSGAAGLPAGVYPLLPARYGLMPGAYLVQLEPGFKSLEPGTIGALADGTPVVAGYVSFGNTGLRSAAGYSGFAIYPGSYSQSLAEYQLSFASGFFNKPPTAPNQPPPVLPADAGTLLIAAGSTLSALGKVESLPGSGGSAATIEISAADLTVTAGPQGSAGNGVSIGAPVLSSWNAGDLLLGGQLSAAGSSIAVTANSVTIGQGAQFTAGQVIAVANQSIEVQSGATVASTSGSSGTALKTLPPSVAVTLSNPDGSADSGAALLAVSDTALPVVVRPAGATGGGTIQIDKGATLSTRGAVALDAPAGVQVAGAVNAPGASWSLASGSIALGTGTSSDTLQITPALLSEMQTAGQIQLSSLGSIDLLSPVTLGASAQGSPTLGALTLSAASINNTTGTSVFGAKALTLQGVTGGAPTSTAGSGALSFVADTLTLGGGSLAINGDSQTSFQASGGVTGQGTGSIAVGGNVSVVAPQLTAASGSETTLAASGSLQIAQSGTAVSPATLASSLGGSLTLMAGNIQDGGTIVVPGGRISLLAAGDITLTPTAMIDAGGITVSAVDQTVGAAGGIIDISAAGNLTLPAGAIVNVSGAGSAPAGSLALAGGQTVTVDANLQGNAAPNAIGGSFTLYAGQLAGGFSSLAGILGSGGFTNQVGVRVQTGDLDLSAGTSLTANQISLTADSGAIDVAGSLIAPSAGQRGSIGLFAASNVVLESGSLLRADGSGAAGRGGEIELSTVSGTLSLDTGSVVSAAGPAQMGTLLLRAPAIVSTGDVAINSIDPATVSGVGQVMIEPVSVYTYAQIGDPTANFGLIQTALQSYLSQALTVIHGRFPFTDATGASKVIVQPGVLFEAGTAGAPPVDLTLSQPLDLYALQLGVPIDFTVRASGNLTINGTISDGMVGDSLPATAAPSSSLRFVAGADLSSANPLATLPQLGPPSPTATPANLVLAPGVLVRTGTGDVNLVAANDVQFGAGSSAYTSGIAGAPAAPVRLGSGNIGQISFATGGGNVVVSAGGDVVGNAVTVAISDWQLRNISKDGTSAEWGVDFAAFDSAPWTLATFGGGDLRVTAGRDALNVSAAAADSQPLPTTVGSTAAHFASGGLTLDAGRDVTSGQFLVADGTGTLSAGRSFGSNLTSASGAPVGSLFAVEDAQLSVWAEGDIAIDALLNPTVLYQQRATAGVVANAVFFTYGADSGFSAQSSSGTVTLNNIASNLDQLLGQTVESNTFAQSGGLYVYPANLRLASLTQDLTGAGSGAFVSVLYPSDNGQLQLFAGRDITGLGLRLSDAADSQIATGANPSFGPLGVVAVSQENDFYSNRHLNDPTPISIVAGRDIDGLTLSTPKAGQIAAGRDILNLQYRGEGLNVNDLTLIVAGRDFSDPAVFTESGAPSVSPGAVQVGGPGRLDILAGRNIDLGLSVGVTTVGNLLNPNLATAAGGSITMMAGLGESPDYAGFYKTIIAPSSTYQSQLISYVESITGQSGLTLAEAEAQFTGFTPGEQRPLVDSVFFNELNLSGVEANQTPSPGFTRGYTAINTLFPGSKVGATVNPASPYSGSLKLTYSEIYTLAGGTIDLLVPGGQIDVGVANPPSSGSNTKPPSELGIVAQGAGNVDIYSLGDVNVETSRIFTLGGGNVLIWSNNGNIDAGNGAKSSLSLPPPTYGVDSAGNVILVFNAAVAGSGIRTIQTSAAEPAGNVDLIAPVGTVNAGDAGIGAAGNINIAAVSVVGASNINFGGAATGVPAAVSGLTASLSGAAATAASVSTTATTSLEQNATSEQAAPLAQSAISWLDVFVTGLGEENCKPEDLECLKRQKHD